MIVWTVYSDELQSASKGIPPFEGCILLRHYEVKQNSATLLFSLLSNRVLQSRRQNKPAIMGAVQGSIGLLLIVSGMVQASARAPDSPNKEINEGFYLPSSAIHAKNDTKIFELRNITFSGNVLAEDELSRFNFDEKCSRGLPLSAAWQYYGPYAKPNIRGGQVAVEGIFPHMINKMLHVCCNSSTTVKFGKIFDSIRGLEGHLDQPNKAYDFSFPVTGLSLEDVVFKDMPYIPFVQAPRVALLVHETAEDNKTTQLMNTVFKAWPILIFILVAATLSGIIIWLLVSPSFVRVNEVGFSSC